MAKKVMVVDDSRTVRQQLGVLLTEAGYEVIEASDGVDGAEKIGKTADLAMVICDVNMPNMNGLEMVEQVKGKPEHRALPILMLTTDAQPSLVKRAKEAGAVGWMVKPFDANQLVLTTKHLTRS